MRAEQVLPRYYPVAVAELPALSVQQLRDWLWQRAVHSPAGLLRCHDRRLRGAVVAYRGYGLLCVDAEDAAGEQAFTLAHEAGHFLREHLYPREDLLKRYGPELLAVLNGIRPPTPSERLDALLGRSSLTLDTYLLDREPGRGLTLPREIAAAEAEADWFACELLAPTAALEARFPHPRNDADTAALVEHILVREYALPLGPAGRWARRFLSRRGKPLSLLDCLGMR